jgi:hypothetical protein
VLRTDQKGAIAELKIAARAAQLGIGVSSAYTVERYDLIFDLRPKLLRVRCKWATRYGEIMVVRCYRNRRNRDGLLTRLYSPDEIDAFAAYCADVDECYVLPIEASAGRRNIQLRLADEEQSVAGDQLGERLRIRRYTWSPRGHSSAGRASGWQPEGRRFEPGWLH